MRRVKINKRLGLPPNTKMLMVHADDAGLCRSANEAILHAISDGIVNSLSVMVPCPGFNDFVERATNMQDLDIGLHITLTCEWPRYRWGPISDHQIVPSLVDEKGHFWGHDFYERISANEAGIEARAQLEKALANGIQISHLDCHMNCMYMRDDLFKELVTISEEYGIPLMANKEYSHFFEVDFDQILPRDAIVVSKIYMSSPQNTPFGIEAYYDETIASIRPGLNMLLVHPAYDNEETKWLTGDEPAWGHHWRQRDLNYVCAKKTRALINDHNLTLINWREITKKLKSKAKLENVCIKENA